MDWLSFVKFVGGLAVLIFAGEALVKGAVGVAKRMQVSSLVIGMTVVSIGTSAPELLVSIQAAVNDLPDIAIGNVIGSNIANIALVLGITVIIFPIAISRSTIRFNWPVMMGASILFYLFILDNILVWWEGIIFVGLLALIIVSMIRTSRKEEKAEKAKLSDGESNKPGLWKMLVFIAVGMAGLVFGADWLLDGAVEIAKAFNVSEHVIGVTIVAFGTSVPELATSAVAAFRKESDISVGNLIGSNLFNILAILGITSIVHEIPVSENVLQSDIFWMLGISLILLPIMLIGKKVGRVSGAILLVSYITYILFVLF